MKYLLSAIFLSLAVSLTHARNIIERYQAEIRSPQTCGDPTDALPFYRLYDPTIIDHVYTTNLAVVNADVPSHTFQGVAALVFGTQEESTVPFYRLVNRAAAVNFYTISETERADALQNGYTAPPNNPVTYIYPTQICGSVPFYRLYDEVNTDNFYTTSESERLEFIANGYTDIEIAGYVLPVTSTQCA
ncbi:hypothetical protein C8F04DRAFT_109870 [Mycena alexandri]|uniref:DUF5648 domain-containing protein n=1 Tax=Mycena alexandri TaxID=1745969 RepID=A0AAD6SEA2_9AGAR|nr:hypothetical protein C8F04DRAFT_109870 [Mycena alexandri]